MTLKEIFEILLDQEVEKIEAANGMGSFFKDVLRKILQNNSLNDP